MEFILYGTKQQLEIAGEISIKNGNHNIMSINSAKNLEMIITSKVLASSTFVIIQNT